MSLKDCFLIDTKLYLIKPYAVFGKMIISYYLKEIFIKVHALIFLMQIRMV
jgi:hypothetical protein